MLKRLGVLSCLLSLFAATLAAADITAPDIERFMTTYAQLVPHLDRQDDDEDEEDAVDDDGNFLDLAFIKAEILKSLTGKTEALSIIKRNGYASIEAFAEQTAGITRAYIAHTAMISLDEFEDSLQNMSPEERESLAATPFAQSLQQTREHLSSVPSADTEAVRPYLDRLSEVFDLD